MAINSRGGGGCFCRWTGGGDGGKERASDGGDSSDDDSSGDGDGDGGERDGNGESESGVCGQGTNGEAPCWGRVRKREERGGRASNKGPADG